MDPQTTIVSIARVGAQFHLEKGYMLEALMAMPGGSSSDFSVANFPRYLWEDESGNVHHTHQGKAQTGCSVCVGDFRCAFMMSTNVGVDTATAAARRRQRRLRSWLRHERMTVAMTLAEKLHHTSRGQKFVMVGEEVVHAAHDALRGQKTPPLGVRPGSL